MLKPLLKLINALSSNTHPGSIAHAFACGMLLGFLPKNNLLWYILFIFIMFIRIQRACFSLTIIIGSLIAPLLDPVFNDIGNWILTRETLIPAIAFLQEIPFVAFTKFHNSIVMGSLVFSLVAYIPFYARARVCIFMWRKYLAEKVRNSKIVKIVKQIPLIEKIASFMGD